MKGIRVKPGMAFALLAVAILAAVTALPACSSGSPTTTTAPPTTSAATTTTGTTTTSSPAPTTATTTTTSSPTPTITTATTTASSPTVTATTTTGTMTTAPATTTSTTATTPAVTFQTLASAGAAVYTSSCVLCHGKNGAGSQVCPVVIWGSDSTLGTFSGVTLFTDASGMLNYISKRMPLTTPGSLTHQQYIDVMAYILIKGEKVSSSTVFDESNLGSIPIP